MVFNQPHTQVAGLLVVRFTETVNGKTKASRADFVASEDDNVLVRGISQDQYAMGYFGYAYYLNNKSKLKALPISPYGRKAKLDAKLKGAKAIAPNETTIENIQEKQKQWN